MDAQQVVAVVEQASGWQQAAAVVAVVSGIAGLLTWTARAARRIRGD